MSVPDPVRDDLKAALRRKADAADWLRMSAPRKSALYEQWSRDPSIGGVLGRYLDSRRVRVYIKDTLLKDYVRTRLADEHVPLRALDIPAAPVAESYIKPHGRRLRDGRVICWGRADDWKSIVLAAYERAYLHKDARAFGVVLFSAVGRYAQEDTREMVADAARRLGVERLSWLET